MVRIKVKALWKLSDYLDNTEKEVQMEIMISMLGEDEEIKMLPEIQKLGSGIELGS